MTPTIERAGGVRRAARAGVIAWLLGVALALVLWWLFSSSAGPLGFLASGIVFYYAFHLWPVVPAVTGGASIFAIFAPVPMLSLFWAGFRVTVGTEASSGGAGARRGATVAVGYLAMALLSLPAFALTVGRSPLADPVSTAVIVGTTGVAFPVVFGGLGGWLAAR